jgi:hypothetical protein
MSRGAVLMGGVTFGSLVALLVRSGLRKRSVASTICSPRPPQSLNTPSHLPSPEPLREDVLERYRQAAAV